MNVPERLRAIAKHLRANCEACQGQTGRIGVIARLVSKADIQDHALELERIALWLDQAGIQEVPETPKKRSRRP